VRFNDLIEPAAIRLDRPYGAVVRSPVPIVVQFLRQDTRIPGALGLMGCLAFPVTDPAGGAGPARRPCHCSAPVG
ncbi:MAG TPA: sensory rhodopsin transducer, partial [Micromonospora sp.]|nr:sensory rhodopsin transducer [Micromonospora sp.]